MTQRATARGQAGISLVEMMVGIVVGLIIAIAITSSVAAIGKQFRITGAGASAAESAQLGLAMVERDARMAGAAVFSGSVATMCPRLNAYDATKVPATTNDGTPIGEAWPPVRITDGGTGSDAIDLILTPPAVSINLNVAVTKELPTSASVLKVSEPGGRLAVGDLVLVAQPPPNTSGYPCTLIQVTNITGNCADSTTGCNVNFGSGDSVYNPPNANTAFSITEPYGPGSVLMKMPTFTYTRYQVRCNSLLRHDASITPSCTGTPSYRDSALAAGIVMLKAQYGISNAGSDAIVQWKRASAITTGEMARVKAVRVAIVAQSAEVDGAQVTSSAPVVFDGSQTLDLSALSVPPGKSWQNYRYRVHETVVPVRNSAWNR